MKLPRSLVSLSLVLAFAACAPADETAELDEPLDEAPPAATPAPTTPATTDMEEMTAQVTALGESMITGEVRIDDNGETQTDVTIAISGSEPGAIHQGMIHSGTCDNIGSVVAPLDPLTIGDAGDGEITTTVALPMMTVTDGSHVVVYHEANGDPGAPTACAAIPAHMM
jgi:hypothetical protein